MSKKKYVRKTVRDYTATELSAVYELASQINALNAKGWLRIPEQKKLQHLLGNWNKLPLRLRRLVIADLTK